MASSQSGQASAASPLPKTCENCRHRKIKCNRTDPCSNCVTSGIPCRPPTRTVEHRPRLLVSNHYEKQIDAIHERLIGIEKALRSLTITTAPTPTQKSPHSSSHSDHGSGAPEPTPTPAHFEGGSSFQYQTLRASQVAESFGSFQNAEFVNALSSLKEVLGTQTGSPQAAQQMHFGEDDGQVKRPELELPPMSAVLRILKLIQEKPSLFLVAYFHRDTARLKDVCQRAYFPTEPLTLGDLAVMYGLLMYIIEDFKNDKDFVMDEALKTTDSMCTKNFFICVENYEIMASPSYQSATALLIGGLKAYELRKIPLAWMMVSTAARHVQALGYHRDATLMHDSYQSADAKRRLFWSIYTLERSLSLSLGRAPSLQDYDIDVAVYKPYEIPGMTPWDHGSLLFIEMARVQGRIYEDLYSASAARKTSAERAQVVNQLATRLTEIQKKFAQLSSSSSEALHPEIFDLWFAPSDLVHYSLLTLLHRATSNPDEGAAITPQCFEAARKSLECHLHFFPKFRAGGGMMIAGYVNWFLLYCAFTPFIVIFLHAIASLSEDDVRLLQEVTQSLEDVRQISQDCEHLFEVCKVFCGVASTLVESKQSFAGTSYNPQADSLAFPDVAIQQGFERNILPDIFMHDGTTQINPSDLGDVSAFFGNWISGTQPMMDLFNVDFAEPS